MMSKWFRWFVVSLLFLFSFLVLLVLWLPLDGYAPRIEAELSALLRQPVKINRLQILMWPTPRLGVAGVAIGEHGGIVVNSVSAGLSVSALLHGECVIPRVVISGGRVAQSEVETVLGWITAGHVSPRQTYCRVGELQFSDVEAEIPHVGFERASGNISFNEGGRLGRIEVALPVRQLSAEVTPLAGGGLAVRADAPDLLLPGKMGLKLVNLQLNGVLQAPVFDLKSLTFDLMGGRLSANAKFDWRGELGVAGGWEYAGRQVIYAWPATSRRLTIRGLSARGVFSTHGAEPRSWQGNLKAAGDVGMEGGGLALSPESERTLRFEQARAHLNLAHKLGEVSGLHVRMYGGEVQGGGRIGLDDRQLEADVRIAGVGVEEIVGALSSTVHLTGVLDGQGRLAAGLGEVKQFPRKGRLDAVFTMREGVLGGGKLIRAVNNSVKQADKDELHFQEMSGALLVNKGAIQVGNLKLAADLYDAEGEIRVSPEGQLDGVLDADVKMTASLVSLPLHISGALEAPVVRPAGSTVAGAALGTMLLGPGVGTAIGIRVGGALDRVFRTRQESGQGKAGGGGVKAATDKAHARPAK